MGKYHANDVGSVVLGRPAPSPLPSGEGRGGHFKLWSASLRRIVLHTVRCGGRQKHMTVNKSTTLDPRPKADLTTTLRSELRKHSTSISSNPTASGSDKLSDLLRLSEFSEKENKEEEEEEEVRRKVEALEELKRVVRSLQASQGDGDGLVRVLEGARDIRKLTKDDPEARTTLALLGVIPPLVALLDSPDLSSRIAALYALLNLGIGNDA